MIEQEFGSEGWHHNVVGNYRLLYQRRFGRPLPLSDRMIFRSWKNNCVNLDVDEDVLLELDFLQKNGCPDEGCPHFGTPHSHPE